MFLILSKVISFGKTSYISVTGIPMVSSNIFHLVGKTAHWCCYVSALSENGDQPKLQCMMPSENCYGNNIESVEVETVKPWARLPDSIVGLCGTHLWLFFSLFVLSDTSLLFWRPSAHKSGCALSVIARGATDAEVSVSGSTFRTTAYITFSGPTPPEAHKSFKVYKNA